MKKIILIGFLISINCNAITKGEKVKYCNFDTGKVEISEVIDLPIVPAINGNNPAIELKDGLVIRPNEIIVLTELKTNCI